MAEPTAYEIADVLDAASDRIIERGWFQDGTPAEAGSECAYLAIPHPEAVEAFAAYVNPGSDHPSDRVIEWNDALGRTEDEVHEALRSCAKALREVAGEAVG